MSQISWQTTVAHQSTENTCHGGLCRDFVVCRDLSCYDPLYNFKGARSAPGGGWPPHRDSAARANRRRERGAASARSWSASGGNRDAPGAGCLPLALAGHVGAGEHSSPAGHRSGSSPQHRQWRAESRRRAIPPAPHREALQDQPLGRSLRSRRCAMPSAPLRLSLGRDSLGANRRDGRVRTLAGPVATACSNRPEPC